MAWFASALAFLLASLALTVAGYGGPAGWAGGTALAVVHLFALGWLCQMMLGSLIQFAPVLAARPLARPGLALPALLFCTSGTLMLAAGFLSLDGWEPGRLLLSLAPLPLALAFGFALAMLAPVLAGKGAWRQSEARAVLAGLLGLAALWLSGAGMALALTGFGPGGLVAGGLPAHMVLGAGGWLTLAAMGVSYKLFAMFLLAPERDTGLRRAGFFAALAALALALAALAMAWLERGAALPLALALATGGVAALCYLAEIFRLWRARRRPKPEVNMNFSRVSLLFLVATLLLLAPAALLGGPFAEGAVFLALAGWLSTLTLAQMIKITSFLTWIQVFSPLIGRQKVPMVQDLSDPRAVARWLWLWTAGVVCATLALLAGTGAGFRLAAALMLAAALGLAYEAWAIRRLRHLSPALRPALLPPVILPPHPTPVQGRSSLHDRPHPIRT